MTRHTHTHTCTHNNNTHTHTHSHLHFVRYRGVPRFIFSFSLSLHPPVTPLPLSFIPLFIPYFCNYIRIPLGDPTPRMEHINELCTQSICLYTLAVSPSLGGSRQHKRNKQKQWGFHSVLSAMTRDPAEFEWHCWSNTTHPPPSSTTYIAS